MIKVHKSVIIPYTPKQMFELVAAFDEYPKYLPWCTNSIIKEQTEEHIIGAIYLEYLKIKTHFVTSNTYAKYSVIEMRLIEGPFEQLYGRWEFTQLGEGGCKIDFNLEYKFSSTIVEKIIGPLFSYISSNIINNFVEEAKRQYGSTT